MPPNVGDAQWKWVTSIRCPRPKLRPEWPRRESSANFRRACDRRSGDLSVSPHWRLADEPLPAERSQYRESGARNLRANRGDQRDCVLAFAKTGPLPADVYPLLRPNLHRRWFSRFHSPLHVHLASETDVGCDAYEHGIGTTGLRSI
jgi:hypothetical protein